MQTDARGGLPTTYPAETREQADNRRVDQRLHHPLVTHPSTVSESKTMRSSRFASHPQTSLSSRANNDRSPALLPIAFLSCPSPSKPKAWRRFAVSAVRLAES